MPTIPESHLDILNSTALAYIATIGPKGEPQVSTVWFGWDQTHLFFSMNSIRQKHRNLLRDPRIAIAITDPDNPYRSLEIRGVAQIEPDPTHHYPNLLSQKYFKRNVNSDEIRPEEERVVIKVKPEHIKVFPFSKVK